MRIEQNLILNQSELLVTKLTAPVQRSKIVKRPRLTDLLRAGMAHKLTLIVAPAGYGKTTLLREWLSITEGMGWPVAWLSLDPEDNNFLQFWSYIVGAIRTVIPDFHFEPFYFSAHPHGAGDFRQFNPLINQIASVSRHFSLVLDDYQVITDSQIHESVSYFIDHLPENFHLVLSSRVVPPLSLARLRVLNQLMEIYASDLSFTLEEARTFFEKVMEVGIPAEDIVNINILSEGWIAGLQLIGLSIKSGQDSKSLLDSFAASNRHLIAYLNEEVLYRLDKSIKEFLLKTSILSKLSAPLCDYLLEASGSQNILHYLEQSNVLIAPLDGAGQWFRYHALFAEFLKGSLFNQFPAEVRSLHLRAFDWLVENGHLDQAIPHALEAGETEKAADIVEKCAMRGLIHLDFLTTTQWLERLPKEIFQTRPQLTILSAKLAFSLGLKSWYETVKSELLRIAKQGPELMGGDREASRLALQVLAVQATEACLLGDYDLGISIAKQVLERRAEVDDHTMGMMGHFLSFAYLAKGDLTRALESLEIAFSTDELMDLSEERVTSRCTLARVYMFHGRLHEAIDIYNRAIHYADEKGLEPEVKHFIYAGLGEIYRLMNRLDLADQFSSLAQESFSRYGTGPRVWIYMPDLPLHFAYNRLLHKDYLMAREYIEDAYFITNNYFLVPFLKDRIKLCEVQLWMMQDDRSSITQWLGEVINTDAEKQNLSPFLKIAIAWSWLWLDQPKLATDILTDLDELPVDHVHIRILYHSISALVHQSIGDYTASSRALLSALTLAYPGGYVRPFIDLGSSMNQLLKDLLKVDYLERIGVEVSREIEDYIRKLLLNSEYEFPGKIESSQSSVLDTTIEPLTRRELEILRMIADDLGTKQIAVELNISINTVRTHIKNIFQKLDVHDRNEAVRKAVQLELI